MSRTAALGTERNSINGLNELSKNTFKVEDPTMKEQSNFEVQSTK